MITAKCHEIPCWQSCICWKLKHITGRKQTSGPRPTKKQEPFLHNKTIDQSLCLVLTQLEPSMLGQEILHGAFWLHVFPPTLALRNPLLHFLHDSQLLAWRQRTIGRNVRQETEDRHQILLPLHPIKPPTPFRFGCGQDVLEEGRIQKPVLVISNTFLLLWSLSLMYNLTSLDHPKWLVQALRGYMMSLTG